MEVNDGALFCCFFCLFCFFGCLFRGFGDAAAFDHETVFIICSVCVYQCGFIVCVEEILIGQSNDLIVDPLEQRRISFADGRSDGILAAELRNTDRVAFVLLCLG